jgi:nucleoside-diphosphate-sugar epimerase/lipopolysaccharide/colanic/teichoic acid biosynthesis glycosyltransferase
MIEAESKLQGKRVLVTGAGGFVGSKLTARLLESGAEVLAVMDENTPVSRLESLTGNPKLHLIRCSINDFGDISRKRQNWGEIDYIAHLWLYVTHQDEFGKQCIEDIKMNLLPTMNLTHALGKTVNGICFASSVSVYGNPAHLPLKESDPAAPITSYGATKLAIENCLSAYGRANNVPVAILRYATVYGPGELKHRAIPHFIRNIAGGQPPVIYGDGSEVRDYIYIDDVVRATTMAIAARQNGVFNIGSGRGHTTLEIAQKILKLYSVEMNPTFISGNGRKMNIICDISAAEESLNYYPQTSLEDGLAQEAKWYKNRMTETTTKDNSAAVAAAKDKTNRHLWFSYQLLKNILDRIIAFLGITVLSPLLGLIALIIIFDSHGNPVFAQERVGKDGKKFTVYKFRTMYADNDDGKYREYLKKYVLENAPYRINDDGQEIYKVDDFPTTKFGALLRKTNLDELPQFVNILKGDMSLIGPRPDVPFAVDMYQGWHRARLNVKPGITGLWQVCGRKGLSFDEMARLDIDYIKKQSLLMDVKIFLLTVGTMLKMDGS